MTRLEKEKVLEIIYYDVEDGFGSVRGLYEKARKVDVGITLDMVSTWMRAQPNKQTRTCKNYNSYTAPFPKYAFQFERCQKPSGTFIKIIRTFRQSLRNAFAAACFALADPLTQQLLSLTLSPSFCYYLHLKYQKGESFLICNHCFRHIFANLSPTFRLVIKTSFGP